MQLKLLVAILHCLFLTSFQKSNNFVAFV